MDATFEVIRFQVVPASGAVAVIELEGRPRGGSEALSGAPVLLVEGPVEQLELQPIVELAGPGEGSVCATFAAPLELAVDRATTFALALGRGPLVELPAPHGADEAALEVRLARTVNALRAELHATRAQIGEADVDPDRARLERELADANADLDELRHELLEAHWRVTELEAAVVPRAPRPPRPPRPHPHPRPPRLAEATAEHEAIPRTNHASLGRSTVRSVVLVVLALLFAALLVLVLQVRPV